MMVIGLFIKLLVLSVIVGLAIVGFFYLINTRDSRLDTKSYDKDFDASKLVNFWRFRGREPEDSINPAKELQSYQVRTKAKKPPEEPPQAP